MWLQLKPRTYQTHSKLFHNEHPSGQNLNVIPRTEEIHDEHKKAQVLKYRVKIQLSQMLTLDIAYKQLPPQKHEQTSLIKNQCTHFHFVAALAFRREWLYRLRFCRIFVWQHHHLHLECYQCATVPGRLQALAK